VPNIVDEQSADRILYQIANDCGHVIRLPHDAVEPSLLPQLPACRTAIGNSRELFADGDPSNQVTIRSRTAHEKVRMVGHETVRNNFKSLTIAGAQQFVQDQVDDVGGRKRAMACEGAKGSGKYDEVQRSIDDRAGDGHAARGITGQSPYRLINRVGGPEGPPYMGIWRT
jgi:hypothetical protein